MKHVYKYAFVGLSYKCKMSFNKRIWNMKIMTCGGRSTGPARELHALNMRAFRLSRQIFVKWYCFALLHRVVKRISDVSKERAAAM
jgi:hypothetical protein